MCSFGYRLINPFLVSFWMLVVFFAFIASNSELIGYGSEKASIETVELEAAAALIGNGNEPCRIVFYQPTGGGTWRDAKPGRLVVYASSENREKVILWQCYREDIFLERADLLQYYRVTKIEAADVDDDGIDEAVISWDSDCMGSGWVQTLEVLNYDPAKKEFDSYRGVTATGPFGGFLVDSLDPEGNIQRVFAYSYKSDGMDSYTGTECRWCPHRYRIGVYTITEDGLVIDPHWNSGEIAYTQLRFPCNGSGNPTDEYRSLNEYYTRSSLYNALATNPPFVVLSPQPNQAVSLPFQLRAEIPQEMPKLGIRITSEAPDGNEQVLLEDIIEGTAYEPSTSWKVEDTPYYSRPTSGTGRVVLFDPFDPENEARKFVIPILFEPVETRTVEIYFPNSQMGSGALVFPVERTIPVAESTLDQLARGPTGPEEEMGYYTNLLPTCKAQNYYYVEYPCRAKLWDIRLEAGVARFTPYDWATLQTIKQPGLDGRIAREQIRQTVLQFPDISSVTFWGPDGSLIAKFRGHHTYL